MKCLFLPMAEQGFQLQAEALLIWVQGSQPQPQGHRNSPVQQTPYVHLMAQD